MEKIIIGLLYLYGISAAFAALYFNYLFAVEKGFMAWLLFGEIIATFQGLIWPLYYFQIL